MSEAEDNHNAPASPWPEVARQSGLMPERAICVRKILGPHRDIVLIHAGQRYRLSLTSNDRLILTK